MKTRFGLTPEQLRILILLGILNVLVVCGVGWIVVSTISKPQVQAAPTLATTIPPTATPQLDSTKTPGAPPTSTPKPMTSTEHAYISGYVTTMGSIADAFENIAVMTDLTAESPSIMLTEDWKVAVASQLAIIRLANEDLRELEPSERIETCHIQLLRVADNYDSSINKLANGIDSLDADLIKSASNDMETATDIFLRFQKCIDDRVPKP